MDIAALVFNFLTLVLVIISGLLIKNYLPGYFGEKGKNLATKEDIGEITNEIEKVRNQYTKESEMLRATLGKQSEVHRVQFEKEFEVLYDVWGKLVALKNATLQLRPVLDFYDQDKNEIERKAERLEKFNDAYSDLAKLVEYNQPFYPIAIYQELFKIINITKNEAFEYSYASPDLGERRYKADYWEKAVNNSERIIQLVSGVEEAIRKRITV